ncbi:3-oxoacyl-[acyl-carrier-protein] synthase II [Sporobacter termitidis DSM 10068]|uniref:3-oxoacyl-[acyl-carrier-protein] synthase 2 n=1 Tax=Sporobacter termitidis DSM 10068 TaxID=1123282 RepID=A0A1M5X2L1_9FIRM|nr:beta-ketoacyl-ACP synthase II [Sporobacter termitidis]SHH94010.1 3-oxoacyl-[acyl-carrier-protein] synthase II [Sporobacter termitidis DSM 10068]
MKRVVVTGMGAITPVGNDVNTMWENLVAGRHGIGPITKFDCTDYKAKLAAEVKDFDPLLYMEKGEARRMDLFSQYAVAAATQAVGDSGILGNVEPERFATSFGSGIGGIVTLTDEHSKLVNGGPRKVSPLFVPMMISNLAAGNIAIRFKAKGSCICIVTACATGCNAIGEAFRAIKHGYADAVITGGSEAAVMPLSIAGFTNMTALSTATDPDAASLPFDKRRAGFIMGEGAGALILEEYEHAKARGAKIYAEVTGYGTTCDAYHITAPDPEADSCARALRDSYQEAGSPADGKIYINAHGTGTPLNDAAETVAIKKAFSDRLGDVVVSSTKSMTGHMLGAAGAVESIISVLSLHTGVVPPTAGLQEQDPECDLDCVPVKSRKADPALAISVSMGFGGHNACVAFSKFDS